MRSTGCHAASRCRCAGRPPCWYRHRRRWRVAIAGCGYCVCHSSCSGRPASRNSAPAFDPNKFTGGIPADYYNELLTDERRPLVNKAIQGRYEPGSIFKPATAILGIEHKLVGLTEKMPVSCSCGYSGCWYGFESLAMDAHIRHAERNAGGAW